MWQAERGENMKYYLFKAGEKEYKLRLTAQNIIDTEARLGYSIFEVLMKTDEGKLPSIEEMLIILRGSLQKYHDDMKMKDVYDIYDEYVENGGDYTGLIETVTEIMKISGFFREEKGKERSKAKVKAG